MRLYSRLGASSVSSEEHGSFDVDDDGAVDVPEPLGQHLHATHVNGAKAWETEAERHNRLVQAEIARRKDPEALLSVVESMAEKQAALVEALGG